MCDQHWVSVWGNAVSVAENRPERYAKDITTRCPVLIPFNGTGLRLTFENYCCTESVTLNKVTVLHKGAFHPVFFGGERSVTIPAGEKAVTDPLTVDITESDLIDGCIDFDRAPEEPDKPNWFRKEYDSGDHLHPGKAGYERMAKVVPAELLK